MPKKEEKEHKPKYKIRWKRLLVFLGIIILGAIFLIILFNTPISNIIVKNNKYLKEIDIIDLCDFDEYPTVLDIKNYSLERKIKNHDLIKDVKISVSFFKMYIEVTEYKVLFYNTENKKIVLESGEEIRVSEIPNYVPTLVNYVPKDIYKELVKKLAKVDDEILKKISDIQYAADNVDDERFILRMNDDNMVYITLPKIKEINKYNDVLTKLEGKKGILYLDAGNYFEIKEG